MTINLSILDFKALMELFHYGFGIGYKSIHIGF